MRLTKTERPVGCVLALAALLAGCESVPRPDTGAPHFVVADVIVSITNRSPRELQLYVGTAALEHALGPVPRRSSRSFSLPSELGDPHGPLHFEARTLRATSGIRSDTFSISPGHQVLWAIDASGGGAVTKR